MPGNSTTWHEARQRLPLPALMTKLGDGQFTIKGAPCPFCGATGRKWRVFKDNTTGKYHFKCHKAQGKAKPACIANRAGKHDEVGYIMLRKGLSLSDAESEFLKLAVPDLIDAPEAESAASTSRVTSTPDNDDHIPGIAPPKKPKPLNPWAAAWLKLPLTVNDFEKLTRERGFSEKTIRTLGFRSNNYSNKRLLEQLADEFPVDLLIREGIFKVEGRQGPRLSGQFYGYGITDEKGNDGERKFAITEPIIIPYLNEQGVPDYCRPHKGGVRKPKDELEELDLSEDAPEHCGSHVYCPYILKELIRECDGVCVLTEGEFKAAALYQCRIAAIACPGITFIRNKAFRDELIGLLREYGVKELVVIFDNEVKDDPAFPKRYKPDPDKQWDTFVYAEYTARTLRETLFQVEGACRVGNLPDELRIDGKADFDGVLAGFVRGTPNHPVFPAEGLGETEGTAAARSVFLKAITTASKEPTVDLWPPHAQRIIKCKVGRMYHKPLVASGGNYEMRLANRFAEYDADTGERIDDQLAEHFRAVRGCYYVRKAPRKEDLADLHAEKDRLSRRITQLKAEAEPPYKELRALYARRQAAWERIKGIPEAISSFTLVCELKVHTNTGEVDRLIRIRDAKVHGPNQSKLRRISAKALSRTSDFRTWCLGTGEAVWKGGEKDLQNLTQDMDHQSYLRDIHEVSTYGYHAESGIWFFGDSAYPPDQRPPGATGPSRYILADKNNIFWVDGVGYQVTESLEHGTDFFSQKVPLLFSPQGRNKKDPPPQFGTSEKPDTAALFAKISRDMHDTFGSYDGWLLVGNMLAYAASPELRKIAGHPGIWLSGKMSSGKTWIARWAMRIWGFEELGGIKLGEKSTTAVGLNRGLAQYCGLPFFLDEYRRASIEKEKEEVLRGAFDGSGGLKSIVGDPRKTRNPTALTTPMICGESSSSDSATRSRYIQLHVSTADRIGDGTARFRVIQNECRYWHLIGRWLMLHRREFTSGVTELLDLWMNSPTVRTHISNDRIRFVYGSAFAAYVTAANMLGTLTPEDRMAFERFIHKHGAIGLSDVMEETFLHQWWHDVITFLKRNPSERKYFSVRFVTIGENGHLTQVAAGHKDAHRVCYFDAAAIFQAYQHDKRNRGEVEQLSQNDLRREMEKEPYWLPFPRGTRSHRVTINRAKISSWVISLERQDEDEGNGELRPYRCPFAEELIAVLSEPSGEADSAP